MFDRILPLVQQHATPFWTYDAAIIRQRISQLQGFDVIRFAQKACSNVHVLKLMREQGVQVDAVSLGEIERALLAGFSPQGEPAGLVFTCDLLDRPTLARIIELDVEVNCGSIDMLRQLGQQHPGHRVWIRLNPGFGHGHSQKTNTGGENSKHGIWHSQLGEALAVVRQYDLQLVGLHMHIGSGVDYAHLEEVCTAMADAVIGMGHDLEAISAGGGLSVPYKDDQQPVDTERYAAIWNSARQRVQAHLGHPVRLEIEPGRFLVAESGTLVTEVRAVKDMGSQHFVLVDAGFNDLMRPSMYGSYHGFTLLDRDGQPRTGALQPSVVAGPLCESGDVFTQHEGGLVAPRLLPRAEVGDLLVIHTTGAYGASMSSNYNSRPLIPEVLLDGDQVKLIRRRQTLAELFALELEA